MEILKHRISPSALAAVIVFVIIGIFSATHLVTMPRIFFDEAQAIEVAHNFRLFGVLDITTAPGTYSGAPYIVGSTGYPVTVPLAAFFKIAGFGFTQARIYAFLWFLLFFITTWFFVKAFWNQSFATAAIALCMGFASLHDSGRRVMGDIPGFILMLMGLIVLFKKQKLFLAGILFGLAVAAKPSVYLLILPALAITFFILNWRQSIRVLVTIACGVIISIGIWILLQFPNPLELRTWSNVLTSYGNYFGSSYSLWESVLSNIKSLASQTSLVYFLILSLATLIALWGKLRQKDPLTLFVVSYCILDAIYFLKSPGRIRYLLPLELFVIIILPSTIAFFVAQLQSYYARSGKILYQHLWLLIIILMSVFHVNQFLFLSSVLAKNTAHIETLRVLGRYDTEKIGIISSPQIAAFVPSERKLHYLQETDHIVFGENPLDLATSDLPDLMVLPRGYQESYPLTATQTKKLESYDLILENKWLVYQRRPR